MHALLNSNVMCFFLALGTVTPSQGLAVDLRGCKSNYPLAKVSSM